MRSELDMALLDGRLSRVEITVNASGFRLMFLACFLLAGGVSYCQFLEAVVPTGVSPVELVWNRAWNKVFCSNSQDASITVISGATNEVLATIPTFDYPGFLCLNEDGTKLYCTGGENDDQLAVTDAIADTVMKTVTIPYRPGHMVYNATMNKLYISCNDDPVYRITVLDAVADTVLRHIPVRGVGRLLWNPASNRVFCYTDWGEDTVKAVDCETDEVAARVPVDGGGYQLGDWCFNPANDLVYLSTRYGVHVYTPTGDSEVCAVPGRAGAALAAARFPNKLLAVGAGPGGTVVRVIDCRGHFVLDSILVGGAGISMVTDGAKGRVYCSNTNARKVDIIDARADTLIKTIPLGRSPGALCWNRTNSRVYIADFMDNVVYVIRDTSTSITESQWPMAGSQRPGATVTRGAFVWPRHANGALLDMSGRVVARLSPGHNDLRVLAPGVYAALAADGGPRLKVVKTE